MKLKSKASKARQKKKSKLEPLRQQMASLVNRANSLAEKLRGSDAGRSSAAFQNALKTLRPSKRGAYEEGTENLFTTSYTRTRELAREAARLQQFLSTADSQLAISESQQKGIDAALKHNISFKNQGASLKAAGVRFMGTDEDRIKFAAKIYRMLEETNTNIYGGYGSDNLINLIYDSVEGYDPNWGEDSPERQKLMESALETGRQALEYHRNFVERMALEGSIDTGSNDLGVLEDISHITNVDDYLRKHNF